ncbi:hypothetical protein FB475_2670 [Kribbella jejuensis]|uniref:Phosphoglyceromutase n=1 Tax=Kribbella jejuensis TaxID=236068 RepID=A0A542ETM3_9ACTN|nr:hypothetical protein FB475_2670 [Kribbella jejuensis]
MRFTGVRRALFVIAAALLCTTGTAFAQPSTLMAKVVVIGVSGLTWGDVKSSPGLTALVNQSNVGSMSVKTAGPRTCPVDGWLTISAGSRAWGTGTEQECADLPAVTGGKVEGWQTYVDRQAQHHTGAPIGRLGASRDGICGFGPGAALAVAKPDGSVADWSPAFDAAKLASPACQDAIVDGGVLPPREGRTEALLKVADLVAKARAAGGWVLLTGVSQEKLLSHQQTLVALQLPPDNGARWLTSDSTRRPGLIQLTDITATVLRGQAASVDPAGEEKAGPLGGSEIHATGDVHTNAAAVIDDRLDANQRYEQPRPVLKAVAATLAAALALSLGWFLIRRNSLWARRTAIFALLTQAGFFVAVFLSTATVWWRWPSPGLALYGVTIGISAASAALSLLLLKRYAYLGLSLAVYVVLVIDAVLGTPMQLGSMFADGPVIGGRFYGFGNSTFAALAVAALVLAGWAAQQLLDRSRALAALAVLAVGGIAIVVDGKPGWGTDFGGILGLTPAVLLMAWMTWRGRVSWRALLGVAVGGVLAVSAVAYLDYLRPPAQRSHFGNFAARVIEGDVGDVLVRKLQAALAVFHSPAGWILLVALVLCMLATVLPERVPFASYRTFYLSRPMIRPTLVALTVCGLAGSLLNDVGIIVAGIMGGFAVPMLVAHLMGVPRPATVSPESHLVQES